ncbi:hypothetical protein GUJ93_ZPchr0004g39512 [Zizania palustris]|uniref:Uncharacterized protein n=1 Tax=Zizania palustris TaxID=103762 RepID=A0A8J5VG15_ZIZPA|nr:hypothetical protein GUJ93_ZPchr0004g39512 [Zizania palustris]
MSACLRAHCMHRAMPGRVMPAPSAMPPAMCVAPCTPSSCLCAPEYPTAPHSFASYARHVRRVAVGHCRHASRVHPPLARLAAWLVAWPSTPH